MEEFFTIPEVADKLRVSDKTVRNMIAAHLLGATRVGIGTGKLLISKEALDAYIEASSTPATRTGSHSA